MFFLEEGSFEGHGGGFGFCAWFGGIEGEHRWVLIVDGQATAEQSASNRCRSISGLMRVEERRRTECRVVEASLLVCVGGGHWWVP